ncbi:hypothetical protein H8356DRAFT_1307623 [Neocallimastix lanati (nom. inval.)]|nr:hypothetical protein H8356DRAFT_1307623 [Neocallimastix sp. JGI-2020a]
MEKKDQKLNDIRKDFYQRKIMLLKNKNSRKIINNIFINDFNVESESKPSLFDKLFKKNINNSIYEEKIEKDKSEEHDISDIDKNENHKEINNGMSDNFNNIDKDEEQQVNKKEYNAKQIIDNKINVDINQIADDKIDNESIAPIIDSESNINTKQNVKNKINKDSEKFVDNKSNIDNEQNIYNKQNYNTELAVEDKDENTNPTANNNVQKKSSRFINNPLMTYIVNTLIENTTDNFKSKVPDQNLLTNDISEVNETGMNKGDVSSINNNMSFDSKVKKSSFKDFTENKSAMNDDSQLQEENIFNIKKQRPKKSKIGKKQEKPKVKYNNNEYQKVKLIISENESDIESEHESEEENYREFRKQNYLRVNKKRNEKPSFSKKLFSTLISPLKSLKNLFILFVILSCLYAVLYYNKSFLSSSIFKFKNKKPYESYYDYNSFGGELSKNDNYYHDSNYSNNVNNYYSNGSGLINRKYTNYNHIAVKNSTSFTTTTYFPNLNQQSIYNKQK